MIDRTTKSRPGLIPHQQGGSRAVAEPQNGTALHQASQIPVSGDFLPIFLPKEATQRNRGDISTGHSDRLEWPIRVCYQLPKLVLRVRFPSPALGIRAGQWHCCADHHTVTRVLDLRLTVTRWSVRRVQGAPPGPLGAPASRGSDDAAAGCSDRSRRVTVHRVRGERLSAYRPALERCGSGAQESAGYAGWRCQPSPTIVERIVATDAWEAEFQPLRIRPAIVDTSFLIADVLTTRPRSRAERREAIAHCSRRASSPRLPRPRPSRRAHREDRLSHRRVGGGCPCKRRISGAW